MQKNKERVRYMCKVEILTDAEVAVMKILYLRTPDVIKV